MRRLRTIIATTGIALVAAVALPASANAATLTPSTSTTVSTTTGYSWGLSSTDRLQLGPVLDHRLRWGLASTNGYSWGL